MQSEQTGRRLNSLLRFLPFLIILTALWMAAVWPVRGQGVRFMAPPPQGFTAAGAVATTLFPPVFAKTSNAASTLYLHNEAASTATIHKNVVVQAQNATGMFNSQVHQITIGAGSFGGCANVTEIPQSECEALVAFYNSTNGPNWTNNAGWVASNTPCSWRGIGCENGHVVSLQLPENQLSGPLPATISNLTNLKWLVLHRNQLAGPVRPELGTLAKLQRLVFWDNQLSGTIPVALASLPELRDLILSSNQLTGEIPPELGRLTNLAVLHLGGNQLTGALPAELGALTNLIDLRFGWNQLSGAIPVSFQQLSQLQYLEITGNQLTGNLPPELGNLRQLQRLHLGENQLTGVIPTTYGDLTALTELRLDENQLRGAIPPMFGNLTALKILRLDENQLSGVIPVNLANLTALEELWLNHNQLTGSMPAELGNLSQLWHLSLHHNQLSGELPPSIGQLTKLKNLWLDQNQLSGAIPATLGQLGQLSDVGLHHNQLSGEIPATLGNLSNLEYLFLQGNRFTGPIPTSFANLLKLKELRLNDNQLTGAIPIGLGQLVNLTQLDLANNQLEGAIPAELGQLSNLARLALNRNRLSSSLPNALGNLTKMQRLYLMENQLTGPLPTQLGALTTLINFHFYHTDLCEPTDAAMQNWLDRIPYLESTGLPCDAPSAHLAGVVTDGNGNKLPNIAVSLHRNVNGQGWHEWHTVAGTTTDANGAYRFAGLGQVGYSLYFADPAGQYGAEYHDNVGTLDNATIITASLGATITVNAALDAPVSPMITVNTISGNLTTDTKTGEVTIAMPRTNRTAITITRPATCPDNSTPTKVELLFTIGDNTQLYPMAPTATAPNYQATIPQPDLTANGALAVKVTCGGNANTTNVGAIQLYDPSGRITDAATGLPIVNATVALYTVPGWLPKLSATDTRADTCESHNSKAPTTSWSQPAPIALGVLVNPDLGTISPTVNRMPTNADGRYGWDVAQGCWYVVVTAPGYVTKISPVVGVPPAVTDLDLALTPVASTTKFLYLPVVQR